MSHEPWPIVLLCVGEIVCVSLGEGCAAHAKVGAWPPSSFRVAGRAANTGCHGMYLQAHVRLGCVKARARAAHPGFMQIKNRPCNTQLTAVDRALHGLAAVRYLAVVPSCPADFAQLDRHAGRFEAWPW